eukprot:100356_1
MDTEQLSLLSNIRKSSQLVLNDLIATTHDASNHIDEYNKVDLNKVDVLYENKIDDVLEKLKVKIMHRYAMLKSRRNIKLRNHMQRNYQSCLKAENNIKDINSNQNDSIDRTMKIKNELHTVQQQIHSTKVKDTERIMSLARDSDYISEAIGALNIGKFISDYCENKSQIEIDGKYEQLIEKMEQLFMKIVGTRDATRRIIGITIQREFKQRELRCICDNRVGNLVRLMMQNNPGTYKWIQTLSNEYINGVEVVGFTHKYHYDRLSEYIYDLLNKDNNMLLDNIYEQVVREYVCNYDGWKFCTFDVVSTIFYEHKVSIMDTEIDCIQNQLDILYIELERNARMNKVGVDMFRKWIQNNEYDEDSIIDDIIILQNSSNILRYFIEKYGDGDRYFNVIKNWCNLIL